MKKDIFELTFEAAAVGIAHVDANGKWIRANAQLCIFLGYSPEELFELTFQDITHKDDLAFDLKHTNQLLRGGIDSFTLEKRYIRKDGMETWAQLTASCVRDSEGKIEYFISVIVDINERKRLEHDLKRVEVSFNTTGDGLYWIDLQGNILHVNDAACNMLGYTYNELTSMNISDLDPNVNKTRWEEVIQHLKTVKFIQLESLHLQKNGEVQEVGITGNYFVVDNKEYIFTTIRDLTQTKQILRELEQSNQKYKESNDNLKRAEHLAKLGHWTLDLQSNALFWSDEIYNIFDIDQNKFMATYESFLHAIHPEDREMVNQAYTRSLATQESYQIIHRLLLGNKIKYVLEQCETVFDPEGTPLSSTGTVQDITEMHETHQLFKMHTRQAQMGEMISMIAHQWRQPLAIINAITSQIRMKAMLSEDEDIALINSLIKIEQQSAHLSQTISDYRDFFRPDKPIESILLSDLVNHSLELIDHTVKSQGVTVRCCIHHLIYVEIYRNELIQVIISLLKNSFDAFEENAITNRIIQIDIDHDDRYGILIITDNGGGINKEILDKVFVPYFTTKNQSLGTGLGLYMSKLIIEDHCQGELNISSNNDETTITLKLPYTNL